MKFFIRLAYRGTNYSGWQRQKNAPGIQQVIEEAVHKICKEKVPVIGCGRTDAGVHADQYFAHINLKHAPDFDFCERINRVLPSDIAVYDFIPMPQKAHTQYDAILRTYTYRMHGDKNPFLDNLSAWYPLKELDTEKMLKVCAMLPKYEEYRAFCKRPDSYPSTLCKVQDAELSFDADENKAVFTISSNRFLRGMIRLLVGNMIVVGKGNMSLKEFKNCLQTGQSPKFYNAAHPQGLYLSEVKYSFEELKNLSNKAVFF